MPDGEPAAKIEHARRPAELRPAMERDVGQPFHGQQALGATREL
jgi:hypothetical protein